MLASVADLAALLPGQTIDPDQGLLLLQCATAVVQAAAGGQRILQVVDDVATLMGGTGSWLDLPQIPVTAISAITIDGGTVATGDLAGGGTYRLVGNRLWRGDGWQLNVGFPSEMVVTYTHGLPPGDQRLQLARSATLALARGVLVNPSGLTSERIDDYSVSYAAMSTQMDASPSLKSALRRQYGRRAGLVGVG